jgi:hypothetical protein
MIILKNTTEPQTFYVYREAGVITTNSERDHYTKAEVDAKLNAILAKI